MGYKRDMEDNRICVCVDCARELRKTIKDNRIYVVSQSTCEKCNPSPWSLK